MTCYYLSKDANVCVQNDFVTLLDLGTGKYWGLRADQAQGLGQWIRDWPIQRFEAPEQGEPELLRQLISKGLVTADPNRGKSAVPIKVAIATVLLADHQIGGTTRIRLADVLRFCTSVILARLALHWVALRHIVSYVSWRKACKVDSTSNVDTDVLFGLVSMFDRLRPFAYARQNNCLLHSLALLQFLSHYGVFPEWVFGVRSSPFEAHCWLQWRMTSITDAPLNLDRLAPIMVV